MEEIYIMMEYNPLLERDCEICRADSLQNLIKEFEKYPKNPKVNYFIRRAPKGEEK